MPQLKRWLHTVSSRSPDSQPAHLVKGIPTSHSTMVCDKLATQIATYFRTSVRGNTRRRISRAVTRHVRHSLHASHHITLHPARLV